MNEDEALTNAANPNEPFIGYNVYKRLRDDDSDDDTFDGCDDQQIALCQSAIRMKALLSAFKAQEIEINS